MSKLSGRDIALVCASCILALGGVSIVLLFVVLPHFEVEVPGWVMIVGLVVIVVAGFLNVILTYPPARWRKSSEQEGNDPPTGKGTDASRGQAGPTDGPSAGSR
jgi:hypothetical protein